MKASKGKKNATGTFSVGPDGPTTPPLGVIGLNINVRNIRNRKKEIK